MQARGAEINALLNANGAPSQLPNKSSNPNRDCYQTVIDYAAPVAMYSLALKANMAHLHC